MKVLFLNPSNSPYRDGFYRELARLVDVKYLFYFKDARPAEGLNYEILKWEVPFLGYARGFNLQLKWKLLTEDYDVVVNSDPCSYAAHIAYPIARLRGKKFVTWAELWHYPETLAARIAKPYVRWIVRHSDLCIAAGVKAKKLMEEFGAKKVEIAPNSSFDVKELPESKYWLPKKFILNSGVLRPCDGQLELIRAFKKLNIRDVELVIIGKTTDETYAAQCMKEAEGFPVSFHGYVKHEELKPYYEKCLFLVCNTVPVKGIDPVGSWEMVLNEAMSAGKALISTDVVGGAPDLIHEGRNGYITNAGNEAMLVNHMKMLYHQDLDAFGKCSRKLYEDAFNHKNMAEKFAEALKCL